MATTYLTTLIRRLRLQIGDTDSSSYRYTDEQLELSLIASVEALQPWWNYRYRLDSEDRIYRNENVTFKYAEPPVIQRSDIRPIILMASIIVKSGSLENLAYSLGAWRDAEISYSNIESGRSRDRSLLRDKEELENILKPPQKRLYGSRKTHLHGYEDNIFEG